VKLKKEAKPMIKAVPEDIKDSVGTIVETFNKKVFKGEDCYYQTRYKGVHVYVDRYEYGKISHVFRLSYTGSMTNWEFAIFKYSSETYDQDECMFPGSECLDGTVEGALKAGLKAYPISEINQFLRFFR
jgi:hypothetical protein